MKRPVIAVGSLTAAALLAAGTTIGGFSSAAAQPDDYSAIPVSPNFITDSAAYTAGAPSRSERSAGRYDCLYPPRQHPADNEHHPGSARPAGGDGRTRPDAERVGDRVADGKAQPAAVGTGGTVVTGLSPDGTKSVSVLLFAEGNAAGSIEFEGPENDSVPMDMVVDYGQKQDTAIKDSLAS